MKQILIPSNFNYIGVFLTLRCNFGCSYCINRHGKLEKVDELSTQSWINGLSRIETRPDLPITLQGGEPTLHPGIWEIANALWRQDTPLDLLTNGQFNITKFMNKVSPEVFKREAKYASIRFSFHPHSHDAHSLAIKVYLLQKEGYSVGIWGLNHPSNKNQNRLMKKICGNLGIDFRIKEFLGNYNGKMYGEYKYKEACNGLQSISKKVECKTTELLVAPTGYIFRCHSDLYSNMSPIGHILDEEIKGIGEWKPCSKFGACNPCDIKIKNNRFQEMGHTSVEIKEKV